MIWFIVLILFFYLVGVFFGASCMFLGFHGRKNMRLFKLTGQNSLAISASLAYAMSVFFAVFCFISLMMAAETCRLTIEAFLQI